MDPKLAEKKEKLRDVNAVLDCDGYQILLAEIERQGTKGAETCCDVSLPQAERDAGAGRKAMADELAAYLPALKSALEKSTSSSKQQRQ